MKTRMTPRAPLTTDRRTGGAHRLRRELSSREDLTLRLNELHAEDGTDQCIDFIPLDEDEEDYYAYLLSKLEQGGSHV